MGLPSLAGWTARRSWPEQGVRDDRWSWPQIWAAPCRQSSQGTRRNRSKAKYQAAKRSPRRAAQFGQSAARAPVFGGAPGTSATGTSSKVSSGFLLSVSRTLRGESGLVTTPAVLAVAYRARSGADDLGGPGTAYTAMGEPDDLLPGAQSPVNSSWRRALRARPLGTSQRCTSTEDSTTNTSRASAQSSIGLSSRAKCSHQNCLSSRR